MSTPSASTPASPAAPTTSATPSAATPAPQAKAPAAPAEAPAPPRMLKVKFDGKEVEMPESEVLALASAGKVSTQRFQEEAAMRKQAEELLKFAKANPKQFFEKTGMNARQWAEEYLMQELQMEAMSPEQRKARENEEKLRKFESEEKQRAENAQKEQLRRMEEQHRQNYDQMFTQALHESGLPKTAYTVKRMAELQLINVKNKYELSSAQLAKLVREDYANEQKSLLGALEGDQLLDFLGADTVKKLSKAQIAKLKARQSASGASSAPRVSQPNTPGLTWKELQRRNRRPL